MHNVFCIGFVALTLVGTPLAHAQPPTTKRSELALTFLSHRSGHNLLYISQHDGSNPRPIFGGPITDVPSFDDSYTMFREPHWTRQSPNGKYFASWVYEEGDPFSAYRGQRRPMLWVGDIEATWTRIVNPDCEEEFAWSPDSNRLVFSILSTDHHLGTLQDRPSTTEICIVGVDGSNALCVLEQKGKWFVLDWSPDEKRLLIGRRNLAQKLEDWTSDLFEFRLSDAMDAWNRAEYDPAWNVKHAPKFLDSIKLGLDGMQFSDARYSPARNELAILTYHPQKMHAPNLVADDELGRNRMMRLLGKIYVIDLENGESQKVADYEDGIRGPICWSPDGDEILFSRYLPKDDDRERSSKDKEHGLSIWAVGRDGKHPRFVTTGWSPDFPRSEGRSGKR